MFHRKMINILDISSLSKPRHLAVALTFKKKKINKKHDFFPGEFFVPPKISCFLLKISGHFPSSNGIPHLPSLEPIAVEPIGNAQAHASRLQRNKWIRCKIMLLCFASLGSLGFQWGFSGFWLLFSILENLINVCSCELRTKKHMFKAEEHFHHAPISSSSGFHGLTGAGVGVAVKPVAPSSVKLYDAFHQGSPVFFIPSSC